LGDVEPGAGIVAYKCEFNLAWNYKTNSSHVQDMFSEIRIQDLAPTIPDLLHRL
jgi:hypothetical protein